MNSLVQSLPLGQIEGLVMPSNLGDLIMRLAGATAVLFLGALIAWFVAGVVRNLLKQTDLDNRIASAVTGSSSSNLDIESIMGSVAFWIVMLVALVAALNVLQLNTVSAPLNAFLGTIFEFLPKFGAALAISGLAWVVATVLKGLVIQSARSFDLDSKVTSASADSPIVLSETLGNAIYWFVFLFFLPFILGTLGLQSSLGPVNELLNQILSALPKILKAVLIGGAGWFVANIVRGIVSNLAAATGVDSVGQRVGLSRASTGQSLSSLLGLLTYVLVLIPTVTAALGALEIPAIADPATRMLSQVMNTIPLILTAGAILTIAFFVGKFLADLATSLLRGFGFDNMVSSLGLQETTSAEGGKTPSDIAGFVVLGGTMLFAAVAAIDVLNLPALKTVFTALLAISGQVLVGALIFAVGLYLANFAARFIQSSGMPQANTLATVARVVILAFTGAMALERAGVSTNIVNLAFGLLLGAVAVAIAIAFGLGGRDVASETLRDWVRPFKK